MLGERQSKKGVYLEKSDSIPANDLVGLPILRTAANRTGSSCHEWLLASEGVKHIVGIAIRHIINFLRWIHSDKGVVYPSMKKKF